MHMPGICPYRDFGTWRLWPLSLLFNTDRDEQCKVTGVNKAPEGKYVHCLQTRVHPFGNAHHGA